MILLAGYIIVCILLILGICYSCKRGDEMADEMLRKGDENESDGDSEKHE